MRKKYFSILKDQIKKNGWGWFFKQGSQYFKILFSAASGRALTGPMSAVITLTYRCNQRCTMCDYPSRTRSDRKEMTTDQIKSLLGEIASLPCGGVSFYGGEPLLRPDLVELIEYANNLGLMIHLNTNGYLMDTKLADKIIRAGVDVITLSLDGSNPETHDHQRGRDGAFDGVVNAIRNILKARTVLKTNTKIAVTATITSHNISEVREIVELARELGTDCITIFEAQRLETLPNAFDLEERNQLLQVNRTLFDLKDKYPNFIDNSKSYLKIVRKLLLGEDVRLKCFAPYTDLFIGPYGNLFPCDPLLGLNRPSGKYEPGKLREIWYSKDYQEKRDKLSDCGLCNHMCHRELSLTFNKLWIFPRPKISSTAINIRDGD